MKRYLSNDVTPEPAWVGEITQGQPLVVSDCRQFMRKIPNGAVDLIMTSPEYPGLRGAKGMTVDQWIINETAVRRHMARILNPITGVLVLNVTFPRTERGHFDDRVFVIPGLIKSIIGKQEAGLIECNIWIKPNAPPVGNMTRHNIPAWEPVFVIAMSPDYTFNPVRRPYKPKTVIKSKPGNKVRAKGVGNDYAHGHNELHPGGALATNWFMISSSGDQNRPRAKGGSFPRDLADRFIEQYAPPNAVCFDPYAGVGTFPLQAILAGHGAFGCDIDRDAVRDGLKWIHGEVRKPVQAGLF